jgi:hypothetical protein
MLAIGALDIHLNMSEDPTAVEIAQIMQAF